MFAGTSGFTGPTQGGVSAPSVAWTSDFRKRVAFVKFSLVTEWALSEFGKRSRSGQRRPHAILCTG